ncbi:DUF4349 domain-containing protein [Kitasatospora sp. NPDC058397]|uniref:DUF4349 domain-containing protein n=1 Tax=unclassified Kitasatospora TaxID=2633591 RepID=UPI003656C705
MGRRAGAGALAVATAGVLLVGACSAGGAGRAGEAAKADAVAPTAPAAPAAAPSAAGTAPAAGASAQPVADNRLIAYTAQLTLRTGDVAQVLAKARELTAAAGGYVAAESVSGAVEGGPGSTAGGEAGGQLTLRIPSAAYQQTLDQLAALGQVVSRRSQADDLTQQVADVASRVQTQQASVERVRALMGQAKSLSEVTTLEAELSRREADLESLQKQQKELAGKTSLSTVTLDVRRTAVSPTPTPVPPKGGGEGFGASVGSALGGGWHVLVAIVRALAVGLAAVAPFLLVLGAPGALLYRLWRRRRPAAAPPPESVPQEGPAED